MIFCVINHSYVIKEAFNSFIMVVVMAFINENVEEDVVMVVYIKMVAAMIGVKKVEEVIIKVVVVNYIIISCTQVVVVILEAINNIINFNIDVDPNMVISFSMVIILNIVVNFSHDACFNNATNLNIIVDLNIKVNLNKVINHDSSVVNLNMVVINNLTHHSFNIYLFQFIINTGEEECYHLIYYHCSQYAYNYNLYNVCHRSFNSILDRFLHYVNKYIA